MVCKACPSLRGRFTLHGKGYNIFLLVLVEEIICHVKRKKKKEKKSKSTILALKPSIFVLQVT